MKSNFPATNVAPFTKTAAALAAIHANQMPGVIEGISREFPSIHNKRFMIRNSDQAFLYVVKTMMGNIHHELKRKTPAKKIAEKLRKRVEGQPYFDMHELVKRNDLDGAIVSWLKIAANSKPRRKKRDRE